jgi:hypothetical protein
MGYLAQRTAISIGVSTQADHRLIDTDIELNLDHALRLIQLVPISQCVV